MTPAITLLGNIIRVVDVDGIAHFVASNVCYALGFRDVPRTLQLHFSEDPHVYVSLWSGSPANHRVLNYDQVLRLINARRNINERPKIKQELMRATEGLKCYQEVTRVPVLRFREECTEVAPAQIQAPAVGEAVMTSIELVAFINEQRKAQAEEAGAEFPSKGFSKLGHDDFMRKCPEVLGGGVRNFSDTYVHEQNGQTYPCYRFPKREACLMAMSYSYEIQAKVFDRMTELEAELAAQTQSAAQLPTNPLQDLLAIHKALHGMEGVDPVRLTERTLAAIRQVTGLPTDVVAQALLN